MKPHVILTKTVALIFHENKQNQNTNTEETIELAKEVLKSIGPIDTGMGLNTEAVAAENLKYMLQEMVNNPLEFIYSKLYIVERIKLGTSQLDEYFDIIDNLINDNINDNERSDLINNLKHTLLNHFQSANIEETLSKASSTFRYRRDEIIDVKVFLDKLISDVTLLSESLNYTSKKDAAEMGDIDFADKESVANVIDSMDLKKSDGSLYVTGWNGLNGMTQGGLRPGECVFINALKHNYKTGFTMSLFSQLVTLNKPKTTDPNKKPLALRISFEDSLQNNTHFLYLYNKHNDTREFVSTEDVSREEIGTYLKDKLQSTGFHVKMIRIDPTQYNFNLLIKKLNNLEKQGYAIEILTIDYLLMMPTTGCITTGPTGFDKRDLIRRVRNYCAAKNILFISPHQLSADAKMLIRSGVSEEKFVCDVANKGYFDGCKSLDNEMDLELYIHKFLDKDGNPYLAVQRGKHRVPGIIPEAHKYFMLKFPEGMPIPEDLEGDKTILRKVPSTNKSDKIDIESMVFGMSF